MPAIRSAVESWAPAAAHFSCDLKNVTLLCKPNLSIFCNLFLLFFKHTFCSKLPEIIEVEIPINPGSNYCNYRVVFVFYEMRMNLKCYWNLLKMDRDQDSDASADTTQLLPLETQEEVQVFKANMTIFIRQSVFISSGSSPYFHFIFFISQIYFVFFFSFPLKHII